MSIQFACQCGEPLAAREEYAGRAVRCTACNAVVLVPSPDDYSEDLDTARPSAIQTERPRSRPPWGREESRAAREPDEESDGINPKRKKKSGGAILLLGALLVLLGGGAAVWYLFIHGKGPSPDFDLVPRDAQGFFTLRLADALKTDLGKKAWEAIQSAGDVKLKEQIEKSGLTPEDIERLTVVVSDAEHQVFWVIVRTTKPYDRARILEGLGKSKEKAHQGKTYHYEESTDAGVTFISDQVMVFGKDPGLKRCLEQPARAKSGVLDEALSAASRSKLHLSMGFNMQAMATVMGRQQGMEMMAGVQDLKVYWFNGRIGDSVELEMGFETTDRTKAKQAVSSMEAGLVQARVQVQGLRFMVQKNVGKFTPDDLVRIAGKVLDSIKVKRDGSSVIVTMKIDTQEVNKAVEMLGEAVEKVRGAAGSASARNNFQQVARAMEQHANQNQGRMPARMMLEPKTDRPLRLSWRVAILPQLGEGELYRQIRHNEPWDSDHNKQFWNKMPKCYELPGLPAEKGMTAIQVFTGPNTPFRGNDQARFPASFLDGTSSIILLAEAAQPVHWMKPEDIDRVNPDNIRASLGRRTGQGTMIAMVDGSVRVLSDGVSNTTLKQAIDPQDGQPLGEDWTDD